MDIMEPQQVPAFLTMEIIFAVEYINKKLFSKGNDSMVLLWKSNFLDSGNEKF